MRVLDFEVRDTQAENRYNKDLKPKAARSFVLAFKLHCQRCGLTDFTKISNVGWQEGQHAVNIGGHNEAPG